MVVACATDGFVGEDFIVYTESGRVKENINRQNLGSTIYFYSTRFRIVRVLSE